MVLCRIGLTYNLVTTLNAGGIHTGISSRTCHGGHDQFTFREPLHVESVGCRIKRSAIVRFGKGICYDGNPGGWNNPKIAIFFRDSVYVGAILIRIGIIQGVVKCIIVVSNAGFRSKIAVRGAMAGEPPVASYDDLISH